MTVPASAPLRLATFALLAAFAAGHWASLLEGPPAGRVALAVIVVTGGGGVLMILERARLRALPTSLIAATAALGATALALAAIGVSVRLLWPGGWDELGANLDRGLAGLAGDVDYPYRGANDWSRLAILAAMPITLGAAAALAFWPSSGRRASRRLRLLGLIVAVGLYVGAVAIRPSGAPLVGGLALLVLVAAWLWLPQLRRRDALAAGGAVIAAAALAVPAAARLDGSAPWLDYRDWTWSSNAGASYRWNHAYGPLDWPRDGQTMLAVKSERSLYWKAIVLDRFDGLRWERSETGDIGARPLPPSPEALPLPERADPRWLERISFSIAGLKSEFVVGAGTPIAVEGLEGAVSGPDGTTRLDEGALRGGEAYTLTAYVPDPTPEQLRATPDADAAGLARYTQLQVPGSPTIENPGPSGLRPAELVTVPLRGYEAAGSRAAHQLAASPYAEAYRLARTLSASQPTTYDAVRAIEDYLARGYAYREDVPVHEYPMAAFLFDDRAGYCQHFSGAMALMLRMAGIPSRVVSGFAPGTPDLEQPGVFRVEDFDAHSWVEVYFNDIGWVTFDPTPAASPAAAQTANLPVPGARRQALDSPSLDGGRDPSGIAGRNRINESSDGPALWVVPAVLVLLCLAGATMIALRALRHRRLPAEAAAEAQLRELAKALESLGWSASAGRTLLALERRLRSVGKPTAARYVAGLRTRRYRDARQPPPTPSERRALRRELTSARPLRQRLTGLLAIPPGGPRRA